jgi:hypothetical protein
MITGSATAAVSANNKVTYASSADPHATASTTVPTNGVAVVAAIVDRAVTPSWSNATADVNFHETTGNTVSLLMAHGTANNPSFTGANAFTVGMAMTTFGP